MNAPAQARGLVRYQLAEERSRAELFALWRDIYGDTFEIRATPTEIGAFAGGFAATVGARFVLSAGACSAVGLARSHESLTRHPRDAFAIRLLLAGQAVGRAGESELSAGAGDIIFLDLSRSLALRLGEGGGLARDITLWAPRARMMDLVSDENALHGLVLRAGAPAGKVLGAALAALQAEAPQMNPLEFDSLCDGAFAFAAKAATPILKALGETGAAPPLASFVTIRRYIDRNLASPALDVDQVANAFGLSRASLYRLFAPSGGVAAYIRKARLARAYQEITASQFANRRIGQIAFRLGFKNASAFNRLFHSVYGVSPGQARARTQSAVASPAIASHPAAGASLGSWLDALVS